MVFHRLININLQFFNGHISPTQPCKHMRVIHVIRIVTAGLIMLWSYNGSIINAQEAVFGEHISLSRQNSSIYSVLNQISVKTGYYFVYDTEVVNPDKKVRIREDEKSLSSWLDEIIDNPDLEFNIIENHILIYRPEDKKGDNADPGIKENELITLVGRVLDEDSGDPLPYATVAIKDESLGITTNSDGVFKLIISKEYIDNYLSVYHLGYQSQTLPVRMFRDNKLDVILKTEFISIQEVLIRYYDPLVILRSALGKIGENYNQDPVYLYNFYREGVHRNNRFINYSEAFFQIYKTSWQRIFDQDQVKLLQSRIISNVNQSDSLLLKIRAGVKSSLSLDIVNSRPDFLDLDYLGDYDYSRAGIVFREGKRAFAIAFEQKEHITKPLYTGTLFIDMESLAILGAEFEVHPKYIDKAHDQFRARRNRNYRSTVEKASYTISYKYYDGYYYLNHVRADLNFKYRKRFQLFSNNYHVFVEMVTSKIETSNVNKFERSEALRTDRVFVDGNHTYDHDFWEGYSIITPEQHITEGLSRIESRIESVVTGR